MNSFTGHITEVQTRGNISMVSVKVGGKTEFVSVVIDTPETAPYLANGKKVNVLFKETEVVLATGDTNNISIENKLAGHICAMEKGALLCRLILSTELGEVVAVVSANSILRLGVKENMRVTILIKLNEIILAF